MVPIRPDHFNYIFDPNTLDSLRKQLGLTQAALAKELDVPVNTVSRWETGATTPDAKALAAIYSIVKKRGVTPQFFTSLKQAQNQPINLVFVWDFQSRDFEASDIEDEFLYIREYFDLCFPNTHPSRHFLAYGPSPLLEVRAELRRLGFVVVESYSFINPEIIRHVQEACRTQSARSVVILGTDSGNLSDMLLELKRMNVDIYIFGTDKCDERLRKPLGDGRFVYWDGAFVVTECVEVIRELNGEAISKSEFGNRCKNRLDYSAIYPDDVGFSRRNPYGSLLRWLEAQGLVVTTPVSGKPDLVTIRLLP